MKFVSDDQFDRAIQYETNYLYKVAFYLLFYSGIRRGELLALNINDIDFENKTIRINETVNPKISSVPNPPKTDKSNRIIQILPFLIEMLKPLVKYNQSDDGYIFLHKIKLTTLKNKCDRIFEKIGLKNEELIRIRDLRHSFASYCINKSVDIQILSAYIGHENISITWDTYGHLYPNTQIKLLNKIDKKI